MCISHVIKKRDNSYFYRLGLKKFYQPNLEENSVPVYIRNDGDMQHGVDMEDIVIYRTLCFKRRRSDYKEGPSLSLFIRKEEKKIRTNKNILKYIMGIKQLT
jgi:hypothetical protein